MPHTGIRGGARQRPVRFCGVIVPHDAAKSLIIQGIYWYRKAAAGCFPILPVAKLLILTAQRASMGCFYTYNVLNLIKNPYSRVCERTCARLAHARDPLAGSLSLKTAAYISISSAFLL